MLYHIPSFSNHNQPHTNLVPPRSRSVIFLQTLLTLSNLLPLLHPCLHVPTLYVTPLSLLRFQDSRELGEAKWVRVANTGQIRHCSISSRKKIITTQTVNKCPRGKQTSSLETIKSRNGERKISEQTQTSLKASLNSIFSAQLHCLSFRQGFTRYRLCYAGCPQVLRWQGH